MLVRGLDGVALQPMTAVLVTRKANIAGPAGGPILWQGVMLRRPAVARD